MGEKVMRLAIRGKRREQKRKATEEEGFNI
jgi:hypothetical protein